MNDLNENGNSLLITLLVIVFVSILGVSLLTQTANSNKITVSERYDQSLYYIAEAGLNMEKANLVQALNTAYAATLDQLQNTPVANYPTFNFTSTFNQYLCHQSPIYCTISSKVYNKFNKQFNKQPSVTTTVQQSCLPTREMDCTFTITAKGYLQEEPNKTRDLVQSLTITSERINLDIETGGSSEEITNTPNTPSINPLPIQNAVVISGGLISIHGNADIVGDLASNTNRITKSGSAHSHVGQNVHVSTPIQLADYLPPFVAAPSPFPSLSNNLNLLHQQNIYVNKLVGPKVLNIGSENRTLYVNELDLDDNIIINGSGTLTVIILGEADLKGKMTRSDNDATKLNIYYQGTKDFKTVSNPSSKATVISGSIHVQKSELSIKGGTILGNIYYHGTKPIEINGNGDNNANYLIAPYAKVQSSGNADFTGVILAKEMEINGNHDLIYRPNTLVPLPNPNPTPTPTSPTTPTQPVQLEREPLFIESDIEEQ
jgi:Tfp pilus assembly protein PilX